MRKIVMFFLIIPLMILFTSCPMDPNPTEIKGRVIDFDTKKPLKIELYGSQVTNDSGYFRQIIRGSNGFIEFTKDGYKPFALKIELKRNNNEYKSFTLVNRKSKKKLMDDSYENENSTDFSVFNGGDSLIVELKKNN
jgi:hypothetical protein